jgi:putative RNA 2'-phosphotransferase
LSRRVASGSRARSDVAASKFLSFVLRHRPEVVGLTLDSKGWASIDELVACSATHGIPLTRAAIEHIVATDDKQRFRFSTDGLRIRASQGHSRLVDLGLTSRTPPDLLYHGTAERFLPSILREGLLPGRRLYVHLSPDPVSAASIGRRHGRPVVIEVAARAMNAAGLAFYRSDNGIWLVDAVAPRFLDVPAC